MRLRVGDELHHRFGRRGVRHEHEKRKSGNKRDRCQINKRIVAERAIETPIDCKRGGGKQHRVAVRIGAHDHFVAEISAGTSFVLDDDLMAPDFRELLGKEARDRIRRSSRCDRDDDAHHPIWPIRRFLCPRRTIDEVGREHAPGG